MDVYFNSTKIGKSKKDSFTPIPSHFYPMFEDSDSATIAGSTVQSPHTYYTPPTISCSAGTLTFGDEELDYFKSKVTYSFSYTYINSTQYLDKVIAEYVIQVGCPHYKSAYDITESLSSYSNLLIDDIPAVITGVSPSEDGIEITAQSSASVSSVYTIPECVKVVRVLDSKRSSHSITGSGNLLTDTFTAVILGEHIASSVYYNSTSYNVDSCSYDGFQTTINFSKRRFYTYN